MLRGTLELKDRVEIKESSNQEIQGTLLSFIYNVDQAVLAP